MAADLLARCHLPAVRCLLAAFPRPLRKVFSTGVCGIGP